jgi:acyl carrier protein
MTDKDVLAGLAEIFEDVVGVAPDNVTLEKSLEEDLEVDSLSMVEIAVQVEDKFGVKIQDDDLTGIKTVGDTVDYVLANR